jgi:hypothetical protein
MTSHGAASVLSERQAELPAIFSAVADGHKAFLARTYDQVWAGLGFLPLTLSSCRSDKASPDWIALLKDERRNGGPRFVP